MPSAKKPIDPRLRSLRKAAKLEQKDVAERMHTVRSALSRRETAMRIDDHTIFWLRRYVEACGGRLQTTIYLNGHSIEL